MDTNYTLVYLKLIEEVAQDGELNHKEIRQLAKWLNENPEGRKSWPASMFFPLLKDVFADGQIERPEAEKVGRLIQRVRREWARENSLCGSKLDLNQLDNLITKFDSSKPILPVIETDAGWPSWLDSLLEAGFRPLPNQKWAVAQLGEHNYLASSADPDWGNIYAQVDGEDLKYSYHLTEKRWAYDSVPQDAKSLIATVNELSS